MPSRFDWKSAALWRAVDSLEPVRRRIIVLRYCSGLTFGAIAKRLKAEGYGRYRRAGTVMRLHDRALLNLAGKLRALPFSEGETDE